MAIRVSGLVSGLDTDAIVQELVSAYSTKKDKYVKAQTKLEWKMDAWKTMNSKIYGFYSTSLSSMRLSSAYNLKTSSVSNSSAAKVTASSSAVNGTQSLKIKKLAASAYLTGGEVKAKDGSKVSGSTKLSDLGIEAGSKLGLNGKDIEITSDMTVDKFIAKLKDAGVQANFDANNQRFFVNAAKSGEEGEFALMASNAEGLNALQSLGLFAVKDIDGNETVEMANYRKIVAAGDDGSDKYFTAKAIVDAVDGARLSESDINSYKSIVSNYETLAGVVSNYEAKQNLVKYYEEQQKIIADYAGTVDSYADKLVKETKKDADGNDVKVNYTDAEIAKMKEYNEKNADSTDADVQAQIAKNAEIIEAKDIVDKYHSAVDFTNAAANNNTDLYNEAKTFVNDASNTNAYNSAKSTVEDPDVISGYRIAKSALNAEAAATVKSDAARITGQDSVIELNGATFKSSTGTFSVNGLSITAMEETGDEAVTITTATDTQGIYNKIKDFLGKYNELLKEMDTAYNADSAGSYEPLTDEEKEDLTDKQIEKWEQKIKDSLLRRDTTLGNVSSAMKSIMQKSFEINGKSYSMSSFGINTLGYFAADPNERGSLHIDGNADDASTAGKADKLMAAINSDPEAVMEFFQKISDAMYSDLTKKMASSSTSSIYTIYNDKQMSSEYSSYKKQISKWEEKLDYYEEFYYKKFSAMEKALSQLQSSTNALANLMGTGA